ncbi:MAG: 50S ribosomal protein L29 [Bacteroidetes bacterium]|nr:50S ribosomal protein L29 [Rhodothermia bacterium]MCS7154552.1 50S ribosomal protein L29 [Bacteroidota bacterium]MCX7906269.1 50S ribosomal protein L29 [Bacteroidota bacterium]MDW8137345.1 50S ribosomal protein L29 [Bacteroidota bacterium]MDW8285701.1 50S ribosomal protein L29 [Bacteroidota bacterium]
MKAREIRELSTEEIRQRIREEETELQQLRFRHAVAQLENPAILRTKRRLIARLRTILRERQLNLSPGKSAKG